MSPTGIYVANWHRLRHIEGASQRIQEDTQNHRTACHRTGRSAWCASATPAMPPSPSGSNVSPSEPQRSSRPNSQRRGDIDIAQAAGGEHGREDRRREHRAGGNSIAAPADYERHVEQVVVETPD